MKNLKLKKLYSKLEFLSKEKKLDLIIYTLDETPIEQSFEGTLIDASPSFYYLKCLSKYIRCVALQVEDALPHDTTDDEMIRCMKSLKRTNQNDILRALLE